MGHPTCIIEGLACWLTLCILEKIICNSTNSVQISFIETLKLIVFSWTIWWCYWQNVLMIIEKNNFLTVSWLSGLLSAEIFISTGEWGVHMPPLTSENSYFLRSGPQGATLVMVCGATCGMHVFAGFVDKFFGHFRPEIGYGARQSGSRNLYKMLPIYSSSIWHKAFDPPRLADIYNLTKSPTAKSLTGTLQRIRSAPETQLCKVWLKTWKRFYSDGKCPLDGTWCQRNNCQSSYKGEITPEETDR